MRPAAGMEIDAGSASRFEMYRLLAGALEFPSRAFHERVVRGAFRADVAAAAGGLPCGLAEASPIEALITEEEYGAFQGEYIRLFDVGTVRPPCPLYGGEWGGARRATMEDALRFYGFFGMKMNEGARELPDHVTVQLEFMEVMAFTEGAARTRGEDVGPLVRAERDFLARHLAKWWPLLRRKIGGQRPSAFYDALTAVTHDFIAADLRYVRALSDGEGDAI